MADISSTTWDVHYESQKYKQVDNTSSASFSVKIRGIERTLFRSPSGRDFLTRQRTLEGEKEPIEFMFEIPSTYLAREETCSQYVGNVLSSVFSTTTTIDSSTQRRIVSKISKDAIDNSDLGGKGFSIKADVEVVKAKTYKDFVCVGDYDSQGRRKPTEKDCVICLQEMSSSNGSRILKLACYHNFHRDCILSWLRRKHSCPTCRDDIYNPRPKHRKQGEVNCFYIDKVRRIKLEDKRT